MRLRCDACGGLAPDVVAPILFGQYGWREFGIDGVHEGRRWTADVLLCPTHVGPMQAFIASGGRAGIGPQPPKLRTLRGGLRTEPDFADESKPVTIRD